MLADFEEMNKVQLEEFGSVVTHQPDGTSDAGTEIIAVRLDPSELNEEPIGAFMVLFLSARYSGLASIPARNDIFTVDGKRYRAFVVKQEDRD